MLNNFAFDGFKGCPFRRGVAIYLQWQTAIARIVDADQDLTRIINFRVVDQVITEMSSEESEIRF